MFWFTFTVIVKTDELVSKNLETFGMSQTAQSKTNLSKAIDLMSRLRLRVLLAVDEQFSF